MILVLANRKDAAATALVDRWQHLGARLVVPEMLSSMGFHYRSGAPGSPKAVVGGVHFVDTEIRAVLVRMHAVMSSDVPHIRAEDREYVAAEMTAFLLAWLSALSCPVLGRPTPTSLSGPAHRVEQWIHEAAKAGVPVRPARRSTRGLGLTNEWPELTAAVTVVGDDCIGATTDALAERARAVARVTGARLLDMYFEGSADDPVLFHADSWVDLDNPDIESAVLSLLLGTGTKGQEVVQ